MKTNETSKLNGPLKLIFILSCVMALISLLSLAIFVSKDHLLSKVDCFAIGTFFGAFLAFAIVIGGTLFILTEKRKLTEK